jgi:hypothetical protein
MKNTVFANIVDTGEQRWKTMQDARIGPQLGCSNASEFCEDVLMRAFMAMEGIVNIC